MTEWVIEFSVVNCYLMGKITLKLMENSFLGRVLSDLLLDINFMPSYLSIVTSDICVTCTYFWDNEIC